jgi:hypothetical protein
MAKYIFEFAGCEYHITASQTTVAKCIFCSVLESEKKLIIWSASDDYPTQVLQQNDLRKRHKYQLVKVCPKVFRVVAEEVNMVKPRNAPPIARDKHRAAQLKKRGRPPKWEEKALPSLKKNKKTIDELVAKDRKKLLKQAEKDSKQKPLPDSAKYFRRTNPHKKTMESVLKEAD